MMRRILTTAAALFCTAFAAFGNTATNNCGTGVDNGGGGTAWTTPINACTSGQVTDSSSIPSLSGSDFLVAKNFGFSIPSTATIRGIQVTITRLTDDASGQVVDGGVQLTKDGTTRIGADRSAGAWPTTATAHTYGSTSDLWGTTWTPAEINASTFGISITATNNDANNVHTAQVNAFVTIAVTFTLAARSIAPAIIGAGVRGEGPFQKPSRILYSAALKTEEFEERELPFQKHVFLRRETH